MAVRRPGLAVAALALLAVAIRAQSPVSMENAQLIKEEMGEEMADATAEQHEVALMGVDQHTKDMKVCGYRRAKGLSLRSVSPSFFCRNVECA